MEINRKTLLVSKATLGKFSATLCWAGCGLAGELVSQQDRDPAQQHQNQYVLFCLGTALYKNNNNTCLVFPYISNLNICKKEWKHPKHLFCSMYIVQLYIGVHSTFAVRLFPKRAYLELQCPWKKGFECHRGRCFRR